MALIVCKCKEDKDNCPLHTDILTKERASLKDIKDVIGKRTSEGYKPEPNEKVEVRGD